jgi:hypothetical protein
MVPPAPFPVGNGFSPLSFYYRTCLYCTFSRPTLTCRGEAGGSKPYSNTETLVLYIFTKLSKYRIGLGSEIRKKLSRIQGSKRYRIPDPHQFFPDPGKKFNNSWKIGQNIKNEIILNFVKSVATKRYENKFFHPSLLLLLLRIPGKHPGSATLEYFAVFVLEKLTFPLSIKKAFGSGFQIRIPQKA